MINQPIIIDNVISKIYQKEIETFLLQRNFPWFFQDDITFQKSEDLRSAFSNLIFDPKVGAGNPYNFLAPILYSNTKIPVNQILQIRSFLLLPKGNELNRIDPPHIDQPTPHFVGLYYVNDSEGNTIIYNKKYNLGEYAGALSKVEISKLEVLTEVEPKQGRMVIFDGGFYHASTRPVNKNRCIINYNFI